MKTKQIALILILALCLSLVACGSLDALELTGEWTTTYMFDRSYYAVSLSFTEGNGYSRTVFKDESHYLMENGTYEIHGDQVFCYPNGNKTVSYTVYDFSMGYLNNEGHRYRKNN